jgi:DNA-binding NtrC family response regulator
VRARTILLADDDGGFRSKVRGALSGIYRLTEVADPEGVRSQFRPNLFDLVILDMRLESGREGLDLLREIRLQDELQPVIMVSAYGDTETTLDAVASGALMFLHKSEFSPELLARLVEAVLRQGRLERRAAQLEERLRRGEPAEFIGISPAAQEATRFARRAAENPQALIVVAGELGSGRELLARLIHDRSRQRAQHPFVTLSTCALSEAQIHEALFGSVAGQVPMRRGAFERAQGGLLLIEDAPPLPSAVEAQLCALADRRRPEDPLAPDIQLVLAPRTNRPASWRVPPLAGPVLETYLPPLRDRREDIPLLAAYFLQRLRLNGKTPARTLASDALTALEHHDWPGNVNELRIAIELAALRASFRDDDELRASDLLPIVTVAKASVPTWDYRTHLARAEVWLAEQAIEEKGISQKTALAKALGYNDRFSFMRRLRKRLVDFPELREEFPRVAKIFSP